MSPVLDASMALAWCLPDEHRPDLELVLARVVAEGCHVPAIWPTELVNALLAAERRQRMTSGELEKAGAFFNDLSITIDQADRGVLLKAVVPLAREHRLPVYDASYLELAARIGSELATLDQRLARAAAACGIVVLSA